MAMSCSSIAAYPVEQDSAIHSGPKRYSPSNLVGVRGGGGMETVSRLAISFTDQYPTLGGILSATFAGE